MPTKRSRLPCADKATFYEAILDSILNGIIITDPEGYVLFFSDTYGKFLDLDPQAQLGKYCTEVIESTRMHIVGNTGIAEINHIQRIKDQDMVVQRIPIKKDGMVIAVFGQVMFEDVRDVKALANRLHLLEFKVAAYEKEMFKLRGSRYTMDHIIGESPPMVRLKEESLKASKVQSPVLLLGSSGTGKEMFAHAIHAASDRRLNALIRINCSAIPKDLLEAELFGYEPGAFTGAGSKAKPGKFELAHRGTLFLDEISELPLAMQPKLLRVLEDKEVERLGGTRVNKVDFRLIAATHADLEKLVEEGKFRRDLYYRLNVILLQIPPLQERKEDLPLLVQRLMKSICKTLGLPMPVIAPEVLAIFGQYNWPGNVRELSNILERTLYSLDANERTVTRDHLPDFFRDLRNGADTPHAFLKSLRDKSERQALLHAMRMAKNNKSQAARFLGIHRTALYKKIRKHAITTL